MLRAMTKPALMTFSNIKAIMYSKMSYPKCNCEVTWNKYWTIIFSDAPTPYAKDTEKVLSIHVFVCIHAYLVC